ncbi:MAG: hypothetical protein ACE5KW_05145, partial [Dehalococcoidia bacterium]
MATPLPLSQNSDHNENSWADLNGRWFFAWRMAAACEEALREVHLAMDHHATRSRLDVLERASQLLRLELLRWVRRGEALDMIVQRVPPPS